MTVRQFAFQTNRGTTQPRDSDVAFSECLDCGCWHEEGRCPETEVKLLEESEGQRWRRKNREAQQAAEEA